MTDIQDAITRAFIAAREAGIKEDATLGEESMRGLDCGFAWVVCKPANGKLGRALKATGHAKEHYTGGLSIWNPSFMNTQSISPKAAGAHAFVESLKNDLKGEGYTMLYADSRYD